MCDVLHISDVYIPLCNSLYILIIFIYPCIISLISDIMHGYINMISIYRELQRGML